MKRSFECLLAVLCAPTLAKVKVASLFRYFPAEDEDVYAAASYWDGLLSERGVSVRILKHCVKTGAVLVFVYRPAQLEEILSRPEIREFLRRNEYSELSLSSVLAQLSDRLCLAQEFPHEIGIFLGYPLSDVRAFMENRGRNYTYCGYWKAYGDPTEARNCSVRYKTCEQLYRNMYENGISIMQLTVAA